MGSMKNNEGQSQSNESNKSDLIEFIVKQGYFIFCKKLGKDYFYVNIPKTLTSKEITIEYKITRTKNGCNISKNSQQLSKQVELKVPSYAVRSVIIADLCRVCKVMNYDPELVSYYDENNLCLGYGKTGIMSCDIIEPPRQKALKDKELNLLALFYQTEELGKSSELTCFAEEMNLLDGYSKILEVME